MEQNAVDRSGEFCSGNLVVGAGDFEDGGPQ